MIDCNVAPSSSAHHRGNANVHSPYEKPHRVLCVGNELCHDDGVALAVAAQLRAMKVDADVIEAGEFGLSCLDVFTSAQKVIVVDAVTTGEAPGHCGIWDDPAQMPKGTCSIGHAISLASMLELLRALDGDKVPKVSLVGIEALDLSPFGTTLSPNVQSAVSTAVRLICGELGCPYPDEVVLATASAIESG